MSRLERIRRSGALRTVFLIEPYLYLMVWTNILIGAPPVTVSWGVVAAVLLLKRWALGFTVPPSITNWPIALVVVGWAISLTQAPVPNLGGDYLQSGLATILLYWSIQTAYQVRSDFWKWLIPALVLPLGIAAAIFVLGNPAEKAFGFNAVILKAIGTSVSPIPAISAMNAVGEAVAWLTPLALSFSLWYPRRGLRWVIATVGILSLVMLILCGSFGGWVAAFLGIAAAVIWRWRWTWSIFAGIVVLTGLYAALTWNGSLVLDGLTSTQSLLGRYHLWEKAVQDYALRPLTGYGLGYWLLWPYNANGSQLGDLHNTLLQAGLQGGIAALLGLAGLWACVGILLYRARRNALDRSRWSVVTAITCSLMTIFIYGLYETNMDAIVSPTLQAIPFPGYHYVIIPYFYILLGVLEGVTRHPAPDQGKPLPSQASTAG